MEQQKARSRQRNGLGIALVGRLGSHSQRRIQATRLSVLIGRMQWTCLWLLQNADEAKMQTSCSGMFVGMLRTGFGLVNINDMCLRPFRARIFSRWLSVGLSVFSPEISEITGFRWYIHASDFPPKSQRWWDFEPAKMGSKCFMLKVMYWKVIVFWGGHIGLQRFVHVQCHFQPLPTKLVFAYFDRGSYGKMVPLHKVWM